MAAALPFIALGSAAVSAVGSMQQANAASQAASYNSQIAQNNAKIAEQNASYAGAEGAEAAGIQSQKTRATVGAELANQGASGVDVNSGSDVDVRASQESLGQLDALTIRSQAAQKAYGYQTEAASDTAQSQLDKYESSADEEGGYLKAGGTLLSTVANPNYNFSSWLSNKSAINDPTGTIYASS